MCPKQGEGLLCGRVWSLNVSSLAEKERSLALGGQPVLDPGGTGLISPFRAKLRCCDTSMLPSFGAADAAQARHDADHVCCWGTLPRELLLRIFTHFQCPLEANDRRG